MSVILDALKRVQDENRRRGVTPETREASEPEPSSNALLRRLAAPRGDDSARGPSSRRDGRKVSPVIWISAACVVAVLATAAGLAWFQPTFDGPAVNDGRPLLTQMESRGANPAGAQSSGAVRESFGGSGGGAGSASGVPQDGAAGMAGLEARQGEAEEGGDDLFSDLSANLETSEASAAQAAPAAADEEPDDDSMLRLEVEERPAPARVQPAQPGAGSATGDSFLDIRSASPGQTTGTQTPQQRPWQPPAPVESTSAPPVERGGSSVPTRLVDPGVRAAFAEGVRLQKAGDLGGAADAYGRALKFDPHNARVNANLGVLYESQGQLTLAERHLRAAVQTEPDNAPAHNNLGVVLYRQGKYDAALIEFNRTLQLDPRYLDAYTNKGLIYTRWGQLEDAERAFRQVLAIDPVNALAHYNLGLVYEELDRLPEALESYYMFLDTGGMQHPEITAYLDRHLEWLERRVERGEGRG